MNEIELTALVNRIKNRRMELNLSYQDVADRIGVSKSTLQRYETGYIKKVPINQISELAKALHTTPGYLMGWEPAPTKEELTPSEKAHLDKYRTLTPTNKSAINLQMDFMLYQQELDVQKEGLCSAS